MFPRNIYEPHSNVRRAKMPLGPHVFRCNCDKNLCSHRPFPEPFLVLALTSEEPILSHASPLPCCFRRPTQCSLPPTGLTSPSGMGSVSSLPSGKALYDSSPATATPSRICWTDLRRATRFPDMGGYRHQRQGPAGLRGVATATTASGRETPRPSLLYGLRFACI